MPEAVATGCLDPELERKQLGRLQAVRARRDATAVERTLSSLRTVAAREANVMPTLLDCARARIRGRDRPRPAGRLRHVPRDARLLTFV